LCEVVAKGTFGKHAGLQLFKHNFLSALNKP